MEEGQRIFGIVPNFFVTYDHNAVPLPAKQKYELAFKTLVDPETISVDLLSSGLQQRTGGLKGYGTGADGFAKRFASSYGTGSIDTLLGSAYLHFHRCFKYRIRDISIKERDLCNGERCMP